jgi:uncharacterized protein YjbI with pentapeptide repeats
VTAGILTAVALLRPETYSGGSLFSGDRDREIEILKDEVKAKARLDLEAARSNARSTGRDSGLKVATGVGALAAALLAWGRLELSKDEQDSERYSKAIGHLSSERPDAQLGGLYALESLALTAARDHQGTIVEVISAFVRRATTAADYATQASLTPTVEVQAALSILARHQWPTPIDLAGANLANAQLEGANFVKAELTGVDLTNANLSNGNFNGANFGAATLTNVNFIGANLLRANLYNCEVSSVNFTGADCTRAIFAEARFTPTPLPTDQDASLAEHYLRAFRSRYLSEANFTDANFIGADFTGADFTGAYFALAHRGGVTAADLKVARANFTGAIFYRAKFTGANFTRANFTGAKFDRAKFDRANFTDVHPDALKILSDRHGGSIETHDKLRETVESAEIE